MSKPANDADQPASRLEAVQSRVTDGVSTAKHAASDALSSARDIASEKFGMAKDGAADLRERAATRVEDNPFAALIGGLALGAVAAAILPRTAKEVQLLGALGARFTDAAREAVGAAKVAGKDSMADLGLNQDRARETVSKLFGDIVKAASTAATAGASAARESASGAR